MSGVGNHRHDQKRSVLQTLIVSTASAAVSKTTLAPIDRVKILLQCQGELVQSRRLPVPYQGAMDCIVRVYQSEGFLSLWRSNLMNVIQFVPVQVLNFALKDIIKHFFTFTRRDTYETVMIKNMLSGGIAGVLSLSVVYSLDYTRTRLAADIKSSHGNRSRQFKGIIDVYRQTLASDGIAGLYRGVTVSCVGIFVYRGCYFGFYDTLKPIFLTEGCSIARLYSLGYTVAVCAGIIAYPIDTVRRRMLMRSCEPVKYRGSLDCARQIFRQEGLKGFMRGAGVHIVSGFASGSLLVLVDKIKSYYFS